MSNPVTAALIKNITNRELREFVKNWDDLESLIIQIYRGQEVTQVDRSEYVKLHSDLLGQYPRWKGELEQYWRQSYVKDQDEVDDPFAFLLRQGNPAEYIGDWEGMKRLPAAREALNQYLISMIENSES